MTLALAVLIEPEAPLAAQARALNARLRRDSPEGFPLDATHVPHISILHRFIHATALDSVSSAVAAIVSRAELLSTVLSTTGYGAGDDGPLRTIVINVHRTSALQRLQEEVEQAVAPYVAAGGSAEAFVRSPGPARIDQGTIDYVASFVPLRMGDGFRPHLTVGKCSAALARKLLAERFEPLDFGIQRFAIYQLGNHGTARLRLWPA